jgi:hypothetical protein
MSFPDLRDHKEIVISSSSSSATGQERKEVYNLGLVRGTRFIIMVLEDVVALVLVFRFVRKRKKEPSHST